MNSTLHRVPVTRWIVVGDRLRIVGAKDDAGIPLHTPSSWVELAFAVPRPIEEPAILPSPSVLDPNTYVKRQVPDVILGFREGIQLPPNHDMGLLLRPETQSTTAIRVCPADSETGEAGVFRLVEDQGQLPRTDEAKTIHRLGLGRGTDPDQSNCLAEFEKPRSRSSDQDGSKPTSTPPCRCRPR